MTWKQNETEIRQRIKEGQYDGPTTGLMNGFTQANLVILPQNLAYDFLLFCQRNPKPCPLLEVIDTGKYEPKETAPGKDLRTDLPRYYIYRDGVKSAEVTDINKYWTQDLVSFLLGCSFTFESFFLQRGVPVRHIEEGVNVPMYRTNIKCKDAGVFHGNMVVSMRPIPENKLTEAIQITSRFPAVHGAPIHIGSPEKIGIKDLDSPDFGNRVNVESGEIPVFWACGVTPQAVIMNYRPEFVITHAPGHMFITDKKDMDYFQL
ncbi:putative hydro-lyase [Natranaerobius thermophilus]|uniref:Putative hydro-lyase Nther_1142 n=1 Tax=Natranaerobius thermophilus (strain ATCC BAA-1301 / DSM 18059 / JW/NM-WN-LF) TaxID=457570 RepID=Y1142_NATTJ|nr:putative hydro-lyase [Natranaerobius thermophilus]B2A1I5.1 RecName: Full=Putative hydro-lyase Nther_1142 [Natranaerobius thermophilus JW/NM-WN-LF]ACB84725.1 protein of unknown function DUF1445 [Natranaerobius thermophilus JW/NM-WN-LF]